MILELYMKNCALVEELRLQIDKNLNILTGETGSGKSIIIDALGLCLGEKYDRTFLRKGSEKGLVEALFYVENEKLKNLLNENGFDIEENLLIISREINIDGKSIPRINNRVCRVSLLKEISSYLIDIHSQHQNQALFNKDKHLEFLDLFGHDKLKTLKEDYLSMYKEYKSVIKEYKVLTQNKNDLEIEREIDLIKFQLSEIEDANLDKDEYDELIQKRDVYRNSEKIYSSLNNAYQILNFEEINPIDLIGNAVREISNVSKYDEVLENTSSEVQRIMYELQDISRDIRNYQENISFDEYELSQIENRVDEINNLKRKYGNSIEEIFEYYEKIKSNLENILGKDEKVEKLKLKIKELELILKEKAKLLTLKRKEVALNLEEKITNELHSLDMKNTIFKVLFEEIDFSNNGCDNVEYLISFNLGEDLKPIYKVASGGEMSRFMLSFKSILSDIDSINTLVFDEIDTGISGIAAEIVGEKLREISHKKQILCITHLPQIAVKGNTHYLIEKHSDKERTYTNIKKLNLDQRTKEISRLIGGSSITDKTIEHAREILQLNN
ncbi:MAG: DNA repair protein RecN [Peptostreptococcaceae bacterium]